MVAKPATTAEKFRVPFTRRYGWGLFAYNTNLRSTLAYKFFTLIHERQLITFPPAYFEEKRRHCGFSHQSEEALEYQSGLIHCLRS